MASVFANGRSIAHKGDGGVNIAAIPDVCYTPIIIPIPIPYVNIAMMTDLADGSQDVKIEGNPAAKDSSNLSMSTGDEAGSIGGVVSGQIKGKLTWACGSSDVLIEGAGAVRFADIALHNGESPNTLFIQAGSPG